ncbi:spermidine/putrescine ABC transporter ATP-binding protein [Thalassospira profundimaris]|uniref:Spermidine/putrescine ABC transporter ATP-binding protein n=1 Tax=Thalassospira profundimaris TaxID=502049 RepID=A0A367XJM6_9PROT|nr:ABC transporter ATP-binding protein [Thalassospira profundimaris]RCK53639.1 spermidine/putrescine ABC transporter ATP-binding protein [Thalassospira profundimaris]
MAVINLRNITKQFGDYRAVNNVSLDIADGEFVALLGPSGCGKTTLLRLLAGFEEPDEGTISLAGQVVADGVSRQMVAPEDRNLGIVFQSYALWPHMSVARNVGYPLEVRKMLRAERDRRIREALSIVSLENYADRSPSELSGGQRQRVALARCLVMEPRAVLLDEPLANLDVHLRETMQEAFLDFHRRTGATMIYVTHDQAEAMAMADRIAVMDRGHIRQMAAPETLYREPSDQMVAGFVGAGAVLPVGDITLQNNGRCAVRLGDADISARICARVASQTGANDALGLCLRPEDIRVDGHGTLAGKVEDCVYLGGRFRLAVRLANGHALPVYSDLRARIGENISLSVRDGWVFSRQEAA